MIPDVQIRPNYVAYNDANASFSNHADAPVDLLPDAEQLKIFGLSEADRFITQTGVHNLTYGDQTGMTGVNYGHAEFVMRANISQQSPTGPAIFSGGSFELIGDNPFVNGETTVSLLSGTFTSMTGKIANNNLEFVGAVDAGEFATSDLFGVTGTQVIFKLGNLGGVSSFFADFTVVGTSSNLGRPVPEPSTLAVWCIGAGTLVLGRRRRQR